jgi:thymidylate synthase (FAD)
VILVNPSYEILDIPERQKALKKIERIGRTCYASEDRISDDSASKFIKMLIQKNHGAMLEHESISVKFIINRSVANELVRHRICSFAQESQRYCAYNKKGLAFIIPDWITTLSPGEYTKSSLPITSESSMLWLRTIMHDEEVYNTFLNLHHWKPEQARDILPNATKTEIVVTTNIREWRLIFQLRTAPDAFSQMRQVMKPLLAELKLQLPEFFDDICIPL